MNLIQKVRQTPKRFVALAALVVAGVSAAAVMAWGPDRPTYTIEQPADHITFNSITNNPAYGDERNFVRVKPASASDSAYSDYTKLVAGQEYEVYFYYHNNAAANLNLVAKNTTAKMLLPAVVNGDTKSVAYITASNATPQQIWDDTTLTSSESLNISMVSGSATIHNFGATNGKQLPDSLTTTGTYIGFDKLDGNLPGCSHYAGYITFRFKATKANFTVSKSVSKHNADQWVENYTAQPGETVDYLLEYKNTGSEVQKNVVIKRCPASRH